MQGRRDPRTPTDAHERRAREGVGPWAGSEGVENVSVYAHKAEDAHKLSEAWRAGLLANDHAHSDAHKDARDSKELLKENDIDDTSGLSEEDASPSHHRLSSMSDPLPSRLSDHLPNHLSDRLSDHLPNHLSDRLSDHLTDHLASLRPSGPLSDGGGGGGSDTSDTGFADGR